MPKRLPGPAGIGPLKTPLFNMLFSYMKYTNIGSYSTAMANGMRLLEEFEDDVNTITKVYGITREEWEQCR